MSSKHSILLGTDTPASSGGSSSGERILTPSKHILQAAEAREKSVSTSTSTGTSTSMSVQTDTAEDSSVSTPAENSNNLLASSSSAATVSRGGKAPRDLSQINPEDGDAPLSAASSAKIGLSSSLSQSMSTLAAAFASLRQGDHHAAVEAVTARGGKAISAEDEQKALDQALNSLRTGSAPAATSGNSVNSQALSTCFDLVTSTAQRVPLSQIIAASSGGATGGKAGASATTSKVDIDSYVVLEPIDWTRHHADCTFARLTSHNRGADSAEEICLELSKEKDALESELEAAKKTMEAQRKEIEALKQQLANARTAAPVAATAAVATKSVSFGTDSAAAGQRSTTTTSTSTGARPRANKIADSDTDSDDEESEEDNDDMEHADFSTEKKSTNTFSTQT